MSGARNRPASLPHRPDHGHVLALRALGLGDLLTAVPALRGLRRSYPDRRLLLAAPGWLRPVALATGAVDEVLDVPALHPLPPAARGAHLAVNLHGRGPQSTVVLARTRPRQLLAYDLPRAPGVPVCLPWWDDEHEVARWCRLLGAAGIVADPDDLDLDVGEVRRAAGQVLLHVGAGARSRRWPSARWAYLARALVRSGWDVVLTGSVPERPRALAIARAAALAPDRVLAGRTSLPRLTRTVAASACLISGDTGVAHLATALRCPSVVLFGPVGPDQWGPPPGRPWHRALWSGRSAAGGRDSSPILDLTPQDVLDAFGWLVGAGYVTAEPAHQPLARV